MKTFFLFSPKLTNFLAYNLFETKWYLAVLEIEYLKKSSKTPCVLSPPYKWITGILCINAETAMENISYLSPNKMSKSDFCL